MRQLCPHCYTNVTVPDELAGKEATCTYCAKSFPVPGRYTAQVGAAVSAGVAAVAPPPPAPPAPVAPVAPVPVPEAPPGFLPPTPVAPASSGALKEIGFSIPPKLVSWLPAIMLTLVFALTFFPWVASYRGSSAVYSQRPWGALVGGTPARNFKLEDPGIPGGWLDRVRSDWKLLLPFFLLLIVGLLFAWADRGLKSFDPRKVPPLAKLWPYRNFIVGMCALLALLLLIGQFLNGFGMERALRAQVAAQFEPQKVAAGESAAALEKVNHDIEQALRGYDVERTTWAWLALTFLALGALAAVLRPCFEARGDKPAPRFLLRY
jgi:hypothetical protein